MGKKRERERERNKKYKTTQNTKNKLGNLSPNSPIIILNINHLNKSMKRKTMTFKFKKSFRFKKHTQFTGNSFQI